MAKLHLLKIRTSIDTFSTEKCKDTFGLKYIYDYAYLQFKDKILIIIKSFLRTK